VHQRVQQRTGGRVRVGLEAEEDDVDGPDLARVVGGRRRRREVAARRVDADAVAAHRAQVRAAGDDVDVRARAREGGADVRADGAGAQHGDSHRVSSFI
jgi:hypothetical protein